MLVSLVTANAFPLNVSHAIDEEGLGGNQFWIKSCSNTVFAGFYQTMMEWEMCKTWYSDILVGGSGTSFQFSDLRDEDEGSCVKAWMISQFHRELEYAGHYWSGGYRDEYGQYKWATLLHRQLLHLAIRSPDSKQRILLEHQE